MGFYINPVDGTSKEYFLMMYGDPVDVPLEDFDFAGSDSLPVCWVDNGMFSAAGICYSKRELAAFTAPGDNRSKQWFLVKKVHLEAEAGNEDGWISEMIEREYGED